MDYISRVALDFAAIGLTARQALDLEVLHARLEQMLAEGPLTAAQKNVFLAALGMADDLPINAEDPWAATARTDLASIANRESWLALLALAGDGVKPTKKFKKAAGALTAAIGNTAFLDTVRRWFELVKPRPVVRDEHNFFAPAMADANGAALRNLVWACTTIAGERETELLAVICGDLAVRCFTKIAGVGALSQKAGNACIYVLSQLPGLRAVSQLSRLGSRLRYKQAIALVEKAKLECATRVGMQPVDLEEVFDAHVRPRCHGARADRDRRIHRRPRDRWARSDADLLQRAEAAEIGSCGREVDRSKSSFKDLAALVPTVKFRLERWLVEPRSWSLADLRTRYLDHPLAAPLARKLIYATPTAQIIFIDGYPIDIDGKQIELADETRLSLWHPLGRPSDEIAKWRALLASLEVTQQIKQVERELYLATDEHSETRTIRFMHRVMRQHQFAALCRERYWDYRLQGQFDSANNATKHLPAFDLSVELEIQPWGIESTPAYIFLYVQCGALRFYRGDQQVALGDVPPRCFSEILRDVDMFVTVCAR